MDPAHCGLAGNEEGDRLAECGGRFQQPSHQVSFREARALIKWHYKTEWTTQHGPPSDNQMQHPQHHHRPTVDWSHLTACPLHLGLSWSAALGRRCHKKESRACSPAPNVRKRGHRAGHKAPRLQSRSGSPKKTAPGTQMCQHQ